MTSETITDKWLKFVGFDCVMQNGTHSKWTINTETHLIDLRSGFGHWSLSIDGPNTLTIRCRPQCRQDIIRMCSAAGCILPYGNVFIKDLDNEVCNARS